MCAPHVHVSVTPSACLWVRECLHVFAHLSPGLLCVCIYVFPHVCVWICVPLSRPVSVPSRVSSACVHPCVCTQVSGLGQESCPVCVSVCLSRWRWGPLFCVVIPRPLFMVWRMETEIYVVVAPVLAPSEWTLWLRVHTGCGVPGEPWKLVPTAPTRTQAPGPDLVPTSYSLFPFHLLCPTRLQSPAILSLLSLPPCSGL